MGIDVRDEEDGVDSDDDSSDDDDEDDPSLPVPARIMQAKRRLAQRLEERASYMLDLDGQLLAAQRSELDTYDNSIPQDVRLQRVLAQVLQVEIHIEELRTLVNRPDPTEAPGPVAAALVRAAQSLIDGREACYADVRRNFVASPADAGEGGWATARRFAANDAPRLRRAAAQEMGPDRGEVRRLMGGRGAAPAARRRATSHGHPARRRRTGPPSPSPSGAPPPAPAATRGIMRPVWVTIRPSRRLRRLRRPRPGGDSAAVALCRRPAGAPAAAVAVALVVAGARSGRHRAGTDGPRKAINCQVGPARHALAQRAAMEQEHAARERCPELRGRPWDDVGSSCGKRISFLAAGSSGASAVAVSAVANGGQGGERPSSNGNRRRRRRSRRDRRHSAAPPPLAAAGRAARAAGRRAGASRRPERRRHTLQWERLQMRQRPPGDPVVTGCVHGLVLPRDDLDGFLGCDPAHDRRDGVHSNAPNARAARWPGPRSWPRRHRLLTPARPLVKKRPRLKGSNPLATPLLDKERSSCTRISRPAPGA